MHSLTVTDLAVVTTRIPVRTTRRHGIGDVEQAVRNVVLRLDTDAGIRGWGEAAPWPVFTGTPEGVAAIERGDKLVGHVDGLEDLHMTLV